MAGLTITSQRSAAVDFSEAFWYEDTAVAIKVCIQIQALNEFHSDLPICCIKSTQRALISQIAFVMTLYGDTSSLPSKVLSVEPMGAPK